MKKLLGCLLTLIFALPQISQANRKGMGIASYPGGFNSAVPVTRIHRDVDALLQHKPGVLRLPIYFSNDSNYHLNQWIAVARQVHAKCLAQDTVLAIAFYRHDGQTSPGNGDFFRIHDEDLFTYRWERFATYFTGRTKVWYVLGNEVPNAGWRATWKDAALAIRQIDPRNPVVFQPRGAIRTSELHTAKVFEGINRVIYSYNFYDFHAFQHNWAGNLRYPSTRRNYQVMREKFRRVAEFENEHDVRVYIGEVAMARHHPDALKFLTHFTKLADEFDIAVTVHAFREHPYWDYENFFVSNAFPAADARIWPLLTNWMDSGAL